MIDFQSEKIYGPPYKPAMPEKARDTFKQFLFKTLEALVSKGIESLVQIFAQLSVYNCRKKKQLSIAYIFNKKNFCSQSVQSSKLINQGNFT